MLGKLMKYDMKSMFRTFVPMWLLAPVISLMLGLSVRSMIAWEKNSGSTLEISGYGIGLIMIVMLLLFTGVMIGLTVMTILFVIQRFWNGLLKEEGYLMFTLPVKTWELITSKGLTATIIACISVVVRILSCMILTVAFTDEVFLELMRWWSYMKKDIAEIGPVFWLQVILSVLLVIAGMVKSIYHVYAAMSLGQLFEGHRVVGSCVSYLGISMVFSVIMVVLSVIMNLVLPNDWLYDYYHYINSSAVTFSVTYMLFLLLVTAVQIAVFHIITERILSTRLNLE